MGLDMMAYAGTKGKPAIEIAYWRKHPNLHGWFTRLWLSKNPTSKAGDFNQVGLPLTKGDLNRLEKDIIAHKLPSTSGFFFGGDSDEYYYTADLEFIRNARAKLKDGYAVWYDSSW